LLAAIQSGITPIRMASGVYGGDFVTTTPNLHIQAMPGAHPVIDGSLTIQGSGSIVEGLEIMSSAWTTRQSAYPDDTPPDITVKDGITVAAANCQILGCDIHDCRQGIYAGSDAPGLKTEGVNLYNNGWLSTLRGSGHGLYLQNNDLGSPKVIQGNVIGPQYGYGLHIYGSSDSHLNGFNLSGNAHLWHGLIGGNSAVSGVTIDDDRFFAEIQLGYNMVQNADVSITDCLLAAQATYALLVYYWTSAIISGNRITTDANFIVDQAGVAVGAWLANDYYHDSVYPEPFGMTWAQWQATGRDAGGSFTTGLPPDRITTGSVIGGRRIVTVENWSDQASVSAPLAGTYTNALNPAESVTLALGAPLTMTGWTVAVPIAGAGPLTTWDSRFGVFVVT
jgi:hypothetical protein